MLTNLKLWRHDDFYQLGSQVFTQVVARAERQVHDSLLPPQFLDDQFNASALYWTIRHLLQARWGL